MKSISIFSYGFRSVIFYMRVQQSQIINLYCTHSFSKKEKKIILLDMLTINTFKWNNDTFALRSKERNLACFDNAFLTPSGCITCPNGTFSFPDWSECKLFFNCSEIIHQVYPKRTNLWWSNNQLPSRMERPTNCPHQM